MSSWEARFFAYGVFGWVRFSLCGVKLIRSLVGVGPVILRFFGVVTFGLWLVFLVLFLSFVWLCLYRCECFFVHFPGVCPL